MLTMAPPFSAISRAIPRHNLNGASRLIFRVFSHASSGYSSTSFQPLVTPAALTRTSRRPRSSSTKRHRRSISAADCRSQRHDAAFSPAARSSAVAACNRSPSAPTRMTSAPGSQQASANAPAQAPAAAGYDRQLPFEGKQLLEIAHRPIGVPVKGATTLCAPAGHVQLRKARLQLRRMDALETQQLIVTEPGSIELQAGKIDEALAPHEALVRTEYSIVSAGTEGAGFTGLVKEMPFGESGRYPRPTGYGNLGEVIAVGSGDLMWPSRRPGAELFQPRQLRQGGRRPLAAPSRTSRGSRRADGLRAHGRGQHQRPALVVGAARRHGAGNRDGAGRQLRRPAVPACRRRRPWPRTCPTTGCGGRGGVRH